MLRNTPTIKLSHILSSIPKFSFFEELINIPSPPSSGSGTTFKLSQRDMFQITKVLEDINLYLNDVLMTFNNIQQASRNVTDLLNWYFEGKAIFLELIRNFDNIDSIISQLLSVLEATDGGIGNNLFGVFEEINDLSLEVKKSSIIFKKYVEIAINYRELIDSVIKTLSDEIEDCIKCVLKLKELKLSSPKKVLPEYTLQTIVSKMKINDLSNGTFSFKSMRLPTFSDLDEKLYNDYLELDSKIDPLRISLSIVPVKIDEFNTMCSGQLFVKSREIVLDTYENLVQKWNLLLKEKNTFKKENINVKWNEIFSYLIEEIYKECDKLVKKIDSTPSDDIPTASLVITDEIGSKYKMCSNCVTLIQKAFKENVITDHELVTIFNHDLVPKWNQVNDLISNDGKPRTQKRQSVHLNSIESNGLRSFQTGSRNSTISTPDKPVSNGLGIDFNIEVDTTSVPISVQKSEKVKDSEKPISRGKNLRHSLISVFEDSTIAHDYEDESTTLVKSPISKKIKELEEESRKVEKKIDFAAYFENVINSSMKVESKLPSVSPDLIKRGHPIIEKDPGSERSKIPAAGSNKSGLGSPHASSGRNYQENNGDDLGSLVSPFKQRKSGSLFVSGHSRTSSNATVIGRPNSLLNEMKVPNLTFSKRLSYNLEGLHEGALSSYESKFDEENLLQALRETSIWK
ncbi:KAR9 Karyogamy protein KAR9 [Candida maltosa Xu316]